MNLTGKIENQRAERVKVELKVQKSLMGYRHSYPADHYIAVVGSGILLGDNNPSLAPRCKRIGNNIWTKEIWLPKESVVSFKFLIVHAATNAAVEIENVPARNVQIGQGPAVIEALFNKGGLIGAYGIQEIHEREEVEVERKLNTEKTLQKPSEKSGGDEETTKCQEQIIAERISSDKGSTGVPDNIKSIIDKIQEGDKDRYMEEINKHTIIQEIDSDRAGVKRVVIGIANSSLKRLNLNIEDMIQAFEKIGLPLSTPSTAYLQEGYSHYEIWLPNKNAEPHSRKGGKNEIDVPPAGFDKPTAGLEEQKNENDILLTDLEEQKNEINLPPSRHGEQNKNYEQISIEMQETHRLTSVKERLKSRSVLYGWFSRKRNVVAAISGVALVSCLGLYAFYKN